PVHAEECRSKARASNGSSEINWLVLTDRDLSLRESENCTSRTVIPMSDIVKLERTDIKPYCLVLETKQGKKYLLEFENDDEPYGWQDAICHRSMGVSSPWNFVHRQHVWVQPATGTYEVSPAHIDQT
ncbi:hypothetical protein DFH07DRAFT_1009662, partial [Mycena maculata]